jgi:hypothetical protein
VLLSSAARFGPPTSRKCEGTFGGARRASRGALPNGTSRREDSRTKANGQRLPGFRLRRPVPAGQGQQSRSWRVKCRTGAKEEPLVIGITPLFPWLSRGQPAIRQNLSLRQVTIRTRPSRSKSASSWRRKLIAAVTTPMILACIRKGKAKGSVETAKRLRANVGAVFRSAIANGAVRTDPTYALRDTLIRPKVTPRAAVTDPEALGGLMRAFEGFHGQAVTRIARQLLAILTPRPGELRQAFWSEFDMDAAAGSMLGNLHCHTPEHYQAWSLNLGHENIAMTLSAYTPVSTTRQGQPIGAMTSTGCSPPDTWHLTEAGYPTPVQHS